MARRGPQAQPANMALLNTLLERKVRLLDYGSIARVHACRVLVAGCKGGGSVAHIWRAPGVFRCRQSVCARAASAAASA